MVVLSPPLCNLPPPWGGGTVTWPKKHKKILGAKENFYKAPKLIYTVILWFSFVVQPPPPPGGGNRHDVGGEITGGGSNHSTH